MPNIIWNPYSHDMEVWPTPYGKEVKMLARLRHVLGWLGAGLVVLILAAGTIVWVTKPGKVIATVVHPAVPPLANRM